jgi:hypothetical protein
MKRFELPEMNISMFDAESVTMLSATGKAMEALTKDNGVDADKVMVAEWTVTP